MLGRALRVAACALTLGFPAHSGAQSVTRPGQSWRTIRTANFDFHTPASLEGWTRHVAVRMESYAAAVAGFVGHGPATRVTVIVDDPSGDPNGFAVPLLDRPVIVLWPTPPTPSLTFGEYRDWGEVLAVHEYAHIAHLTYPSRNPQERFWLSLLPASVGPVARKAPPWLFEGYATLIEGRLTGLGRPHSAGRAAVLRQWALNGKLPSYAALNNASTFLGGAMRYLVGSAFLEWLGHRKGDSSFTHVWRRMSARASRSFEQAFAGVYGASPADMYGAFVVELTEQALRVRSAVRTGGVQEGDLIQRLSWSTGEPAVSPGGQHVAVVLRQPNVPSRVVIWRTGPAGVDSAVIRRRREILKKDSLDVAPVDSFPLPRRSVASLRASVGGGYSNPRWMPNGTEVLLSREMSLGNGTSRPDLFLWNWRAKRVRRVTRGAGMRFADPSPDGQRAIATRCDGGSCALAIVNLGDGSWRDLVPGTYDVTWHRPRWSPDGRRIAASVQRNGLWQLCIVDVAAGSLRFILPNDSMSSQHSPAWVGSSLVAVSSRGGIPNLVMVNVDSATTYALTNVVGAVTAPDYSPQDSSVWYLDLQPNGLDVRRLRLGNASPAVLLTPDLAPAVPLPSSAGAMFDSSSIATRGYGLGPAKLRYFPGLAFGADGVYGLLALASYDPAGKLGVLVQGAYGQPRVWRGGSLGIAWRGWSLFDLKAQAFATRPGAPNEDESIRFAGAALSLGRTRDFGSTVWSWQLGASVGQINADDSTDFSRRHGYAELSYAWRRNHGILRSAGARLHGSGGRTGEIDFGRGIATLGITADLELVRLRLSASRGALDLDPDGSTAPAQFEAFSIGGLAPPFFDDQILPQRISVPALPAASSSGRDYVSYRAAATPIGVPASLYAAWFKVYDPNGNWQRLVGVEGDQTFPTIGFASLPNFSLHYGAAYSFDDPRRHRWTLYGGARFAP